MKHLLRFSVAVLAFCFWSCESEVGDISPSNSASTGGSLASFAVMDDLFISINGADLELFDIATDGTLQYKGVVEVGFGLETLFPKGNLLFIGTRFGMYIYQKSGLSVEQISFTEHLESCDPVVANETHAYVTLREGRSCTNGSNLLDVYDISDLTNPLLIQTTSMIGPKGLGITANHLYVCDGENGFNIFNIMEDGKVEAHSQVTGFNAHDIIIIGDLLIVVASENIHQYRIQDDGSVLELSTIKLA